MPQVPRYQRAQVQPTALPTARVSTSVSEEAFGGGDSAAAVTRAAQGLSKTVVDIADKAKKQADDVAVTEAYDELTRAKNAMMWDPKTGAMARRGKDAFGAPEEYGSEFSKLTDGISSRLNNADQRAMFSQISARANTEMQGDLQKHLFSEAKKYDDETTESGIMTARNDAIMNYADPNKVQESIGIQDALIHAHAERNGLPPEWVKLRTEEANSKTHSQVIDRMLANDQDIAAEQYYASIKGDLTGPDAVSVDKAIEVGTLRGKSQRETDTIVAKADSMPTALEKARSISDPKLRDAVEDRVKDYYNLQKLAENERSEARFKSAADIIDKTRDYDKIPPSMLAEMEPQQRTQLRNYIRDLNEGIDPPRNGTTYYALKTLASDPATRTEFKQMDLTVAALGKTTNTEMKELIDIQAGFRKGDPETDKLLDGYRTNSQIVNDTLASIGINPSPKNKKRSEAVAKFRSTVDERIVELQQSTGKKATNQQVQEIVNSLTVQGVTEKGWIWDTKKYAFEVDSNDEMFEVIVPKAEKGKIADALRRAGREASEKNIADLYKRKVQGSVARGN